MQLDCENDAGKCPKVPGKVCTVVPASGSRSSIGDRATARHKNERPPPHKLTPRSESELGPGRWRSCSTDCCESASLTGVPAKTAWGTVCRRSCNSPAMSWSARSRGPGSSADKLHPSPAYQSSPTTRATTAEQRASSPTTPTLSVKARHPHIPNLLSGAIIDLPSVTGPVSRAQRVHAWCMIDGRLWA